MLSSHGANGAFHAVLKGTFNADRYMERMVTQSTFYGARMTSRPKIDPKSPRKHLYPFIREHYERDWNGEDIAEELQARGEDITADAVRHIKRRIMETEHRVHVDRSDETLIRVWFEKLRYRWKRDGKL